MPTKTTKNTKTAVSNAAPKKQAGTTKTRAVVPAAADAQPTQPAPKRVKRSKQNAKANGQPAATKGATILTLIRRQGGATAAELQQATGWQPHSVRGFLSGVVGKKMGLKLNSARREDGARVYTID